MSCVYHITALVHFSLCHFLFSCEMTVLHSVLVNLIMYSLWLHASQFSRTQSSQLCSFRNCDIVMWEGKSQPVGNRQPLRQCILGIVTLSSLCSILPVSAFHFSTQLCMNLTSFWLYVGHAMAQLVEALHYEPEGRGFDSQLCHWNFSLT